MGFFQFRWPRRRDRDDNRSTPRPTPAENVDSLRRRARHRLIGATVLVALGVVGFPLLFDTQPRPVSRSIPITMADRPRETPAAAAPAVGDGDVDAEELEMMKMMGIPVGFDSTKGKHVPDADVSGVRAVSKRQPRQYMNRRGGFNRPLPPERNR